MRAMPPVHHAHGDVQRYCSSGTRSECEKRRPILRCGATRVQHGAVVARRERDSQCERGEQRGQSQECIAQNWIRIPPKTSSGAAGLWIENGEFAFPVSEITIAGNLKQILTDIQQIGSNLEFRSSIDSPSILIGEMTISGV